MRNREYSSPWQGLLSALLIAIVIVGILFVLVVMWVTGGDGAIS